jgi:alkanesulfonate monooxygenase SsuD/methylene tetrahydromethanopterin reductase-like flavin-dependent oxidoreductase (luciferase family)
MLCALAQRTKRIRLGTAISILTFHDPRRIAETYSMLDMISGGRLVFGVGSGYLAHEFVGYDIDSKEKRDRFNENLDIVRQLMAGETLSYKGRYSKSEKVVLKAQPDLHGALRTSTKTLLRTGSTCSARYGRWRRS